MADLQLIRHQLIGMFPMCFSQILMQQDPMDDRQTAIHSIHQYSFQGPEPQSHQKDDTATPKHKGRV